jgi:hypothetical protein
MSIIKQSFQDTFKRVHKNVTICVQCMLTHPEHKCGSPPSAMLLNTRINQSADWGNCCEMLCPLMHILLHARTSQGFMNIFDPLIQLSSGCSKLLLCGATTEKADRNLQAPVHACCLLTAWRTRGTCVPNSIHYLF